MPSFVVKVAPERDAYIVWSTVVEAPTWSGTRAELQEADPATFLDERFDRAGASGTSARFFDWLPADQQPFGWADTQGQIYLQTGFLPRSRLADVYDLLEADIDAEIPREWLVPFDDDPQEDL